MIEIPEAINIAKQLQRIVKNKTIISVIQGQSPHKFAFFNDEIASYAEVLINRSIDDVIASACYVELCLGEYRLAFRDGVNIRYLTHESQIPKKHQLLLQFDDNTYVVCSVQMYGMLWLFQEGHFDNYYYTIANTKPSPLSEEFSESYFLTLLEECLDTLSIKAALATEQRIPGLGNGVLQDILFTAKIHPKRKLKNISLQDRKNLYFSLKKTLQDMVVGGGRNTEKDIFGNTGKYQTLLSSKTFKDPCPVCQGEIIKKSYLGGAIYYCSVCQVES